MENTPLTNAVIHLTEESGKSKGQYGLILKLKGRDVQTGKTNTYTIYELKQDGSISAAWAAYNSGELLGQTVQVGYATKTGTLQDGTPFTQRIIRTIDIDVGNGVANKVAQEPQQAESFNLGHSVASGGPLKDDALWERQAYEKCCSLWAAADMQKGVPIENIDAVIVGGHYWKLFQVIKAEGAKRFSPLRQVVEKLAPKVVIPEEDSPVLSDEEVEGIPF